MRLTQLRKHVWTDNPLYLAGQVMAKAAPGAVLRSATMVSKRRRSAAETEADTPACRRLARPAAEGDPLQASSVSVNPLAAPVTLYPQGNSDDSFHSSFV